MAESNLQEVRCVVDIHSRRDIASPDPHKLRLHFPQVIKGLAFDVPLNDNQVRDLFWKIAEHVPMRLGLACEAQGPMGTQELP